jgi:hypothetical protein
VWAVQAVDNGIYAICQDEALGGMVETSSNIASIHSSDTTIDILSSQRSNVMSNLDNMCATIQAVFELAGAEADKSIDGRSLVPYMKDSALRSRRPLLFESFVETADVEANGEPTAQRAVKELKRRRPAGKDGASASIVAPPKDYEGIRLGPYKYIEWPDGEKELYDINKDPYELNNKIRDANFFPIRAFLHAQLIRLEECVGAGCQEVSPKFPLTREQQRKVDKERREEERIKQKEQEEKKHHKKGSKGGQ